MARISDTFIYDPRPTEMQRADAQREMYERAARLAGLTNPFRNVSFDPAENAAPSDPLASFREPVAKWLRTVGTAVSWSDVVGNQTARDELREAIEAATLNAETYAFYDMTPPKGVLLYGPPGCGKTMFAKAAVNALGGDEYILINGDELQAKWVGETEEHIRNIFTYAREYRKHHGKPLLIFIDEADAMLPPRGEHLAQWRNGQIAQVLTELDGLNSLGAFVVLATNRPDSIDQALLRDGRIDRKVKIARPDRAAAETILRNAIGSPRWLPSQPDVAQIIDRLWSNDYLIQELTNPQSGTTHRFLLSHIMNGAMLVGLVGRAKSLAFRRDVAGHTTSGVTQDDFLIACDLLFAENQPLNHAYAMREFVEDVALPSETIRKYN